MRSSQTAVASSVAVICAVFCATVTPAAASDASTLCVPCDTAYQCTQYAGSSSNVDWFCCPFQKQCIPIDDSDCLCRDGTSSKYGAGGNNFRVENDPNSCGGGKPCHYCSLGDTTTAARDTPTVATVDSQPSSSSVAATTETVADTSGGVATFTTASLVSVVVWVSV